VVATRRVGTAWELNRCLLLVYRNMWLGRCETGRLALRANLNLCDLALWRALRLGLQLRRMRSEYALLRCLSYR
jgi:hypothetical protein